MKRVLQLLLLFGMTMAVGAATAQSKVTFTWTNGNVPVGTTPALPVCPATNPTTCVSGYRLSMDGTQIASESNIGPTATTYTQSPIPAPGIHAYSLIMVGFDGVGNAISSTAATASVTVPAIVTIPAPTGFTVRLQ